MSKHKILFLAIALLLGSGLLWVLLQGSPSGPIEAWNAADIELVEAEIDPEAVALGNGSEAEFERQVLSLDTAAAAIEPSERLRLGIFGRIVDSFGQPLAKATVRLEVADASRGLAGRFRRGQRERVRRPFITGKDGRFSFKLRVYPQTQVNIYASREGLAPRIAEHRFEAGSEDLDTGDTVLTTGGSLIGRIIDIAGNNIAENGIAAAKVDLRPGNDNALRFAPDRDQLLRPIESDAAGFFAFPHLMPGEYRISAEARHHRRRQEPQTIRIEEGQQVDVGNIALGPGFEIFGYVYDQHGAPINGARIEVRNSPTTQRGEPAQGSRGGRRNREERANERSRSRADGSFSVDHLPNAAMSLLVRAKGQLSFRQDDIDPTIGQAITVQLMAGLSITGRVLDQSSGLAVLSYAAKLRRQGNLPQSGNSIAERFRGRRGGRGGERGFGRGNRDPVASLQDATQQFNLWRNPNRIPDDLGEVTEHPAGEFQFDGLDEGIYLIDIGGSPEHHVMRSEPIELRRENGGASVELRLSRGYAISGQVVAKATGLPLAGVRVQLMRVRQQDSNRGANQEGRRGGRDRGGRRGGRDFSRFVTALQGNIPNGERITEVDSDAQGVFRFALQSPSEYFLIASGRDHARSHTEPFILAMDQEGIQLVLGRKASLSGQISGIPSDAEEAVNVIAFAGMRDQQSILAEADGSYHFDDLEPGDYFVRAILGDPQAYRRQVISSLFAMEAPPPFDLSLAEGQQAELNLPLQIPDIGEVRGTILTNGEAAIGYRINLATLSEERTRGRRGFGGGRNQSATSDSRGEFRLRDIPVGEYSLRVQPAGRGRGGDMHRQDIYVQKGLSTDLHIELFIGSIEGTVTAADGSPAEDLRGQIFILPGQTEVPENLRNFARDHPFTRISVSEGKFEASDLNIGPALLVLRINGRKEAGSLIQIQAGRTTEVTVEAGDKVAGK